MAPFTCQHFILPDFLNCFSLICVKWSFTVVLIYISFITTKAKHILKCFLATYSISFGVFFTMPIFLLGSFSLFTWSSLHIHLLVEWIKTFSLNFVYSFLCRTKVLYFHVIKFIDLLRTSSAFWSFFRKSFPTLRL